MFDKIRYVIIGMITFCLIVVIYLVINTFISLNKVYDTSFEEDASYEENYNNTYNSINKDNLTSYSKNCLNEVEKAHSNLLKYKSESITIDSSLNNQYSYLELLNSCKDISKNNSMLNNELTSYISDITLWIYPYPYSRTYLLNIDFGLYDIDNEVEFTSRKKANVINTYNALNLIMNNLEYSEVK